MTTRWPYPARSASRSCQRRSCMVPTAAKSGATLATSTGRARKLLSCLRRPAPQNLEQPPVDRCESEGDQCQSGKVARREQLVEEQAAQQDGNRGNEKRDQQGIGRAG